MAVLKRWAIGLALCGVGLSAIAADRPALLRETAREGETTHVLVTLKAEGLYRPGPPPGAATKAEPAKPLALKVETRVDFTERIAKVDPDGRVRRAIRKIAQAAAAINGEIRPSSAVLRPEVALLVAEPRAEGVVVYSVGGPLTRSELEVVQGAGDPLALADLLSSKPVKVGETWRVGDAAARALSSYDSLADNSLKATLESADERSAKVRLSGDVRGTVLGAEGKMLFEGSLNVDVKAGRIDRLALQRSEARRPGAVEAGLDVKSTLTVTRTAVETPAELGDGVLSSLPAEPDPLREQLLLISPNGKYDLRHDRDWHTYWDDSRLSVLKRLNRGQVVAQCNLSAGPNAGKGRHQDLEQFRSDVRRALGSRFVEFLGQGEVDGDSAGGFRYKVGVRGREGELGVIWYYYLVAGPEGDQLVGTFTLAEAQSKGFAAEDERLIGSLRWRNPPGPSAAPAPAAAAKP